MQHNNVAPPRFQAIEHVSQVIQVEVVADRHQDVAGTRAHRLRAQLAFQFQVEMIHFYVGNAAILAAPLGNREDDVQHDRESPTGHGGHGLGEQVGDRDQEQRDGDKSEPDRNLYAANSEIERHLEFALAWIRVAQHQYGQAVHRKTPDHAEGVKVRQEGNVAAADHDPVDL